MTTLAGRPCMKIRSQSPSIALCHPIECQQTRLSDQKALNPKILALWPVSQELAQRFATLIRSPRRAFQVNSLSARDQQRRLHSWGSVKATTQGLKAWQAFLASNLHYLAHKRMLRIMMILQPPTNKSSQGTTSSSIWDTKEHRWAANKTLTAFCSQTMLRWWQILPLRQHPPRPVRTNRRIREWRRIWFWERMASRRPRSG